MSGFLVDKAHTKKNQAYGNTPVKVNNKVPVNLSKLSYSIPDLVINFPASAHVKDSQNFGYLLTNKNNLDFYGFKSSEELEGKTVFDLEKLMAGKWPLGFAQRVHEEDENVIRKRKNILFTPDCFLNNDGYIAIHSFMKMPLFEDDRIKAILTLVFDSTGSEDVINLFKKYQQIYGKDVKLGNQKFLEYLGLEFRHIPLTIREIECLIALSKYRNVKSAAKELELSSKTLETHLHTIKLKLNCKDLLSITKFFTSNVYRKF